MIAYMQVENMDSAPSSLSALLLYLPVFTSPFSSFICGRGGNKGEKSGREEIFSSANHQHHNDVESSLLSFVRGKIQMTTFILAGKLYLCF